MFLHITFFKIIVNVTLINCTYIYLISHICVDFYSEILSPSPSFNQSQFPGSKNINKI